MTGHIRDVGRRIVFLAEGRTPRHHGLAAGPREVSYTPFTRPLDLIGLL